jgi:hypothetical protein
VFDWNHDLHFTGPIIVIILWSNKIVNSFEIFQWFELNENWNRSLLRETHIGKFYMFTVVSQSLVICYHARISPEEWCELINTPRCEHKSRILATCPFGCIWLKTSGIFQ